MADTTTAPQEGNGTPAPAPAEDRAAALAAARELLLAEGHQVLDPSAFHGIKEKAAEKARREATELKAILEAERAEKAELARFKAEQDAKGKSEIDLLTERQRAWEKQNAEKDAAIEAEKKRTADLQASLEQERVQNRLAALLTGATNADAAMMWAERHVGKMLSVDEAGQLVWTDPTGVPHVGPAAAKLVNEWWQSDAQKFLRSGHAPGPPTSGAPSAPPPKTNPKPERSPGEAMTEYLMRLEVWDAQQRARQ